LSVEVMAGWIKLHKELLDDAVWQMLTPKQTRAFIGFLLQVNYESGEFGCRRCGKAIAQPVGSTSKSYKTLAHRADVTPKVMLDTLRKLAKKGFIINRSGPGCHTLYVVKNWSKYQKQESIEVPGRGPHRVPVRDRAGGHEEEVKKLKNKETTTEGLFSDPNYPPEALSLADRHRALCQEYLGRGVVKMPPKCGDKAWPAERKRWSKQYRRLSIDADDPISWHEQRQALEAAFASEHTWTVDRGEMSWRTVLGGPRAYEAFGQKYHTFSAQCARLPAKRRPKEIIPDNDIRRSRERQEIEREALAAIAAEGKR